MKKWTPDLEQDLNVAIWAVLEKHGLLDDYTPEQAAARDTFMQNQIDGEPSQSWHRENYHAMAKATL